MSICLALATATATWAGTAAPVAAADIDLSQPAPFPVRGGGVKGGGHTLEPETTGRVIVEYRPGTTEQERARSRAATGLRLVEDLAFSNAELVEPIRGLASVAVAGLDADPAVVHASPEHRIVLAAGPNAEPRFSQQWALDNSGQSVGGFPGIADVDMNVPEAWDVTTGDPNLVVAVTDSGVDFSHPDLAGHAWRNAQEATGAAGVDDDGNGLIDDVNGWDFCNEDNTVFDGNTTHGTHVAGSIAASANGVGIAGIAPTVKIMAVRFLNDSDDACATEANAMEAINYAYAMGARIINASWGSYDGSPDSGLGLTVGAASDALIVAAAGNDNNDNDVQEFYPASYDLPNILSVASIHNEGHLTFSSNYGATNVDLAAPGEDILSTVPGGSYALMSGTSMAAANASGVAALAASAKPELLGDPVALRQHLIATARALPSTLGWVAQPRLLDARAAVVDRPDLRRLSGSNRFATAAAISEATYVPFVPYVFIATGANYPDALAGGALAAQAGSPLLLVQQNSIPSETRAEIERVHPLAIYVLGGTSVISNTVLGQLNQLADDGAYRIAGPNRYATAAAIAQSWDPPVRDVFVATGQGFPDALAGVPATAQFESPLLLTARNSLPSETAAAIRRLSPTRVIVIGGSAVVSDVVIGKINDVLGYSGTVRWAGPNRYATASTMSVNSFAWAAETAFVANGFNFPDALAGGPSGGAYGGPMLLTTPTSLPSPTAAELVRRDPARIFVLGGTTQVFETVVSQIDDLFP